MRRVSTLRADLALAGAAFLFGSTFLVMQDAVRDVEPVPFITARFTIGALALLPVLAVRGRPRSATPIAHDARVWRAGIAAGVPLALGYVFQTTGLQYTTSSVSAFLTYLLVVFVPLLSAVLLRRLPRPSTLAGVVVAVIGLYVLTDGAGIGFGKGEALSVLCAVAFAVHILVLSELAPRVDVVALNVVQFAVVGVLLVVPGALAGGYAFPASAWIAAAYTGIAVSAVAFGLQVWGQRHVSASRTALVLMLEPVFAAALGYAHGDRLGVAGAIGGGLILAGILLSEVSGRSLDRAVNSEGG